MNNKQIIFTKPDTAEFMDVEYVKPMPHEVVVKTEFSTVSCGTERANIMGGSNVPGVKSTFPRELGYSSAGYVVEKGSNVKSVEVGDRVIVYWGKHKRYNTVWENYVVKITDDNISMQEAAISFIATFPLAAIRKTRFEIGEGVLVMGLGLLGQLAVRLLKAAGAVPIIGVDPVPERRKEAIMGGADYVFDPLEEGFAEKVKEVTGGGAKVAIEVTGVGAGLDGALDCMARFGRVALLGCTRDKHFEIDYYTKVHSPGITLIGAHTNARPDKESHPGWFSHRDDIAVILKLIGKGRLYLAEMIRETHKPSDCTEVYTRLVNDKNFPIVVQFDWRDE